MDFSVSTTTAVAIGFLIVWELIWKGLALWRAAVLGDKLWYVLILILNTVGILPIIYLIVTRDKKHEQATRN
jgi:hypothetical protein